MNFYYKKIIHPLLPVALIFSLLPAYQSCTGGTEILLRTPDSAPSATAPTLTGITPATGDAAGGTSITLTGTNLTDTSSVTFDGASVSGLAVVNDTTVTALTPAHADGVVDVVLTTPDGSAVLPAAFTYQTVPSLSAITPASGSASGGVGFTLTGTNLTGTLSVTFDGVAATSVNVVNSTTVTGVAPAHAAGVVDIAISTPQGSASLTNGLTYVATTEGQNAHGGIIGCLGGGALEQFIVSTADNSSGIVWGANTLIIATSTTDGPNNTAMIVTALTNNGGTPYAAQLCDNYEVDSQGNTPCQTGNACYNDWFLPATDQYLCIYTNAAAIGGFTSANYWSSTEINSNFAHHFNFSSGVDGTSMKSASRRVRCARLFTP